MRNRLMNVRGQFLALGVITLFGVASTRPAAAQQVQTDEQATIHAESLSRAFRQAASKVLPTVVTIKTTARARALPDFERRENPYRGTPFEEFFDGGSRPRVIPRREGLGSGVIIDPKGIVLTNNHVVEGMDGVVVELADGREFPATEIKTDPGTDLAVLRIKGAGKLPAAALGDSDELQIGDWVLAIGSPFGFESTVSAGIISAKERALRAASRAQFLQTDASINPGNSGGPLVNLRGQVVGVSTAIASRTGTNQGIGFAIPVNLAKWVSNQLVQDGQVKRAYVGVIVTELNAELAEQLGGEVGKGVVVMEIFPDSPAAKAGIKIGDVITSYQGTPITSPRELQEAVEKMVVDAKVNLTYLREKRPNKVTMKLEALPAEATLGGDRVTPSRPATDIESTVGIQVQDIDARRARDLGYENRTSGVLVTGVDPNSVAAEKGIQRGMLILRVGSDEIANVQQFRDAMAKQSVEKGILLFVATPAGNRFVVLKRAKN